jgi:hypothetical protein
MCTMPKPITIPKTLGACADKLYELGRAKALAQVEVDKIAKQEAAIEAYLIEKLPADDADGIVGKVAKVVIRSSSHPIVLDGRWDEIYKWIKKHDAFDLLQRRLNSKAVQERWDNKVRIPGLGTFKSKKVSVTKA